uniref:Glycine-rich domain-containing protein n=1 Tax=viral metagenome TaxID=1070528 RepID=A0A6C0CRX7_9ZZZZ
MSNFKFKSENYIETNIGEVIAEKWFTGGGITVTNDNGHGITNLVNYSPLIRVVKDGTSAGEGRTTTNDNYKVTHSGVSVDLLGGPSLALAKYKFYPQVLNGSLLPTGTTQATMTRSYTNQPIPSWCKYIKVLLIGGGGGGGGGFGVIAAFGGTEHAGTGGGCGELVVACIERQAGDNVYNLTLGKGGDPAERRFVLGGTKNNGETGGTTSFTVGAVTIDARGGKGGSTLYQDSNAGTGGGQTSRDTTVVSNDSDTTSDSKPRERNKYSGNQGTYVHTVYGSGSDVNPGGAAFARFAEVHYGFYALAAGRTSASTGLVREMKSPHMLNEGYGVGGTGCAGTAAPDPTRGVHGCACVMFFPGKPPKYPLGDQA